jgi:hypothetical protein
MGAASASRGVTGLTSTYMTRVFVMIVMRHVSIGLCRFVGLRQLAKRMYDNVTDELCVLIVVALWPCAEGSRTKSASYSREAEMQCNFARLNTRVQR